MKVIVKAHSANSHAVGLHKTLSISNNGQAAEGKYAVNLQRFSP